MEELRIILLSLLGLWFIVSNYRRRQGNVKHRIEDARRNAGKVMEKSQEDPEPDPAEEARDL